MTRTTNQILTGGQPIAELRDLEASGNVSCGMLVEYDGATDSVQAHSEAGGSYTPMVAEVVPYAGDPDDENAPPVEHVYEDGDYLKVVVPNTANRLLMHLDAGENVTVGAKLVSAGNGHLAEQDAEGEGSVMFIAREDVDATGGADWILVEKK